MIDWPWLIAAVFGGAAITIVTLIIIVEVASAPPEPPPLKASVKLGFYDRTPRIGDDFCYRDYWYKVTRIGQYAQGSHYIEIARDPDPVPEKEPRPVQSEIPVYRPNGIMKRPQA